MRNLRGPALGFAIEFASIAALTLLSIGAVLAENKSVTIEQPMFAVTSSLRATFATSAFAQQQPSDAPTQPAAPAQAEPRATNAPATAAATKVTMYVYRLRNQRGMFNKLSVYIDERELARIENGRFFIVHVDPGRHVVRSVDKASAVTVEMQPGQIYFLRVAIEHTQFTFRFETILVPAEQGWSEIGQTEPNDSKEIKDNELAAVGPLPSKPAPASSPAEEPSAPGTCRSVAVTRSSFVAALGRAELGHKQSPDGYKVVDVVNYPSAYVGKWYEMNELPTVQNKNGVHILLLSKGYTPEDVAKAHNFCQSGEGTVADARLQADIGKTIRVLEAADHPGCDLQIVNQLHSADTLGVERWDVKSCDAPSSYDVRIVNSPKGGSDFQVVKSVQEQEQKTDTAAPPPVSSQAATADASPEEWVPYEGQKNEFTIALPKGWVAQDQSQMLGKGNSKFNLILFHPSYPNLTAQDAKSAELMAMKQLTGIDSGEIPSFFVQRVPAKNGMSCAGFSEKAEKDVFKMITGDPILDRKAAIQEAPRSEPLSVAGCKGIRIHGTGQPAKENTPQTLDVYAASDGKVLYLFTLRNQADYYKKNAEVFQKSMATAKLAAVTP
ncbi:MAG TPA: DUF2846 domain-containing protein [Terriglobales bacterium]|nr:DUF2846 domain-containing protein [Terriglobales bacterium]